MDASPLGQQVSPARNQLLPFLLAAGGALGGAALTWICCPRHPSSEGADLKSDGTATAPEVEMDDEGAPDRTLRKAETVLQRRTTRLVIVLERATQSHNYTAVIRTAEAMGCQHVVCLQPPTLMCVRKLHPHLLPAAP